MSELNSRPLTVADARSELAEIDDRIERETNLAKKRAFDLSVAADDVDRDIDRARTIRTKATGMRDATMLVRDRREDLDEETLPETMADLLNYLQVEIASEAAGRETDASRLLRRASHVEENPDADLDGDVEVIRTKAGIAGDEARGLLAAYNLVDEHRERLAEAEEHRAEIDA